MSQFNTLLATEPATLPQGGYYEHAATKRAAAKAGMTVEAWIKYTDRLAAGTRRLRRIDREMRQTPRYRGAAA